MKKILLRAILILSVIAFTSATSNIENIYGKNDGNLNSSFIKVFGNNFGSMLEFNERTPHYVDIQIADDEIGTLTADNEKFSLEIETYTAKIDARRESRAEMMNLLDKIDLLLIDLTSTSAELYGIKTTLTDKVMRQKIQVTIEENRQQIYDLNNKKNTVINDLKRVSELISVSEKFITVNKLYITRNNKKISHLKECIDFSESDTTELISAIEKSTSFQNDVDDILNVSF